MKRLTKILSLRVTLLFLGVGALAEERDFNAEMQARWSAPSAHKQRIKGFDSPDGKLSFFEFHPNETTFSVTVLASADGSIFHGVLPLPPPNMVDDPGTKMSFAKVVRVQWSPDSRYLAVEDTLDKHSKFTLFKIADATLRDVTPKDFRAVAIKAARINESKIRSSGQIPERWTTPNTLRATARFSVSGTAVMIPMEVVIEGDVASTRAQTITRKKAQ